jgi:hypothetical protein
MRATFKHYVELADLVLWFKEWYGLSWERRTEQLAGLYRREITSAQHGHKSFSKQLLPKLRSAQHRLIIGSALADTPRARADAPTAAAPACSN